MLLRVGELRTYPTFNSPFMRFEVDKAELVDDTAYLLSILPS